LKRGDVYDARLDPVEGSEQAGIRPVVIVSRDAINEASPVVIVVPFTRLRKGRRIYPSHVVIRAPEGGLRKDSIALGEQVRAIAKTRLATFRGALSTSAMKKVERSLLISLDLSNP
jgi:mRNA interferase MazF